MLDQWFLMYICTHNLFSFEGTIPSEQSKERRRLREISQQMLRETSKKSGDYSGEVTPVPISNTVVKLLCADDTWREAAWESRSLPV